jgi:hypothetical protein
MSPLSSTLPLVLAAEPASILYIVTGVVGFAYAGLRRSKRAAKTPEAVSTAMLLCRRSSHETLRQARLL